MEKVKSEEKGKRRTKQRKPPEDRREVFCRYITKNGKRVYPKNAKFFHFWV